MFTVIVALSPTRTVEPSGKLIPSPIAERLRVKLAPSLTVTDLAPQILASLPLSLYVLTVGLLEVETVDVVVPSITTLPFPLPP